VPRKDTSADVKALLGQAGEQYRRPTSQPPATATETEPSEAAPEAPTTPSAPPASQREVIELRPEQSSHEARTTASTRAPRPTTKSAATADEAAQNAPRTIRLSQPKANDLRGAWINARLAGEVLLTYQDFADRIVATGLRADAERLRAQH
jgi:hypothetical protein